MLIGEQQIEMAPKWVRALAATRAAVQPNNGQSLGA